MPSSGNSKLAMQDIKLRLYSMGMLDLEDLSDKTNLFLNPTTTTTTATTTPNVITPISERADAIVPFSGGMPESPRAVFIKSNDERENIIEQDVIAAIAAAALAAEAIQKTAHLASPQEAIQISMEVEEQTIINSPLTSPKGVGKLQSWLSYFYTSNSSKNQNNESRNNSPITSPVSSDLSFDQKVDATTKELLQRKPKKSILKPARKQLHLDGIPPPVQKTVFLRQEEVTRLSKFVGKNKNRHQNSDDFIINNNSNLNTTTSITINDKDQSSLEEPRYRSGFSRKPRIRFELEKCRLHQTFSGEEYERGGVEYIAKSLTPEVATMIKRELNEVKGEMEVHEESKHYTQFYLVK